MGRVLRILATVVVLALVAIGGLQWLQSQAAPPDESDLIQDETQVTADDLLVTVSATGTLMPIRQVELVFESSGIVQEVLVEEGQPVRVGDLIARLDTTDLEAALFDAEIALEAQQAAYEALIAPPRPEDIAAAEAALNAARAQVGAAASGPTAEEIEIARLQVELARNQLWQQQMNRDATLEIPPEFRGPFANVEEVQLNSGLQSADYEIFIAEENLEGLENATPDMGALSSANAEVVSAEVALERLLNGPSELELQMAEIDLRMAELAVEQAAINLNKATLLAPFDGIVAANNLVVGEAPPAEDSAMQLIDASSYYVDLPIDETDIVSVQVGQPVHLAFDALPEADITGVVTRVAATPTIVGQLVTYTVRVMLDATDEPIRTGMSATATIVVNELNDVLALPNRFIRIDRQTQQAFVTIRREDGGFEEIAVTLGLRNETRTQIVGGLEAGQQVVLLRRETFNPIEGG
jgi:HlyD family secretion protein